MLCSVSWHLPFLLFISIPIVSADWNFDPQAADTNPSQQLSVFATNNELPENLILEPAVTGVRAEDISVTASDQTQSNALSNGFEFSSDQTDAIISEGPLMAEDDGCLPNSGRSSRKMRVRRGQGICEWNPTRQFREEGSQPPNTEHQHEQITGVKKPGKASPGGGKKRRTSVTVHRVNSEDEAKAEKWFPQESRPKSDKSRCRAPDFDIPVCANFVDSVEMFPAVTGLGPVCILVPATALPCVDLQVEWCCQIVEVAFTGIRITFQAPNPFMLYGVNCIKNDGKIPLIIEMPEVPPPERRGPF